MKKIRLKKQIKLKKSSIIITITLIIIILTTILLIYFIKKINPKILSISTSTLATINDYIFKDIYSYEIINKESLDKITNIYLNDEQEIISIDYNLEETYKILNTANLLIINNLDKLNNGNLTDIYNDNPSYISSKKNNLILQIPVLSALNNNIYSNLGPKIPVKITFLKSVASNIETKVTNYGINNALMEIFLSITIKETIIYPFNNHSLSTNKIILLSSTIIQGRVPTFYGNSIKENTPIINS